MFNRLMFGPQGHIRSGRLVAHKSEDAAFRCGAWFLGVNGNEKAAAWANANGLPITKASGEGTNSAGGFLVPDEIIRTIIALRESRIEPMASDAAELPRRTGGLTAYFTTENAAITESATTWDNVSLASKKLATLTRSSSELDEDAAIDLGEILAMEIAYAFASKEDDCGFNGDGTSTYAGIRGITRILIDGSHDAGKVTAASGHDTFLEINRTDLTNLISKGPAYALPGAGWFISQLGFAATICRIAGSYGGITMMPAATTGRMVPHFMGFPVFFSQVLPQVSTTLLNSVMLLFGDISQSSTLGERRGVTIARSENRYLDQDQVAWRGTERVDIVNHDLGDNTTAGPIVGLVGG